MYIKSESEREREGGRNLSACLCLAACVLENGVYVYFLVWYDKVIVDTDSDSVDTHTHTRVHTHPPSRSLSFEGSLTLMWVSARKQSVGLKVTMT